MIANHSLHSRFRCRRSPARQRQGATLLDVAIGSMLLALLLIPSVRLIGESQSSRTRLHLRDAILFEAENAVERAKIALSETAAFDDAYLRGSTQQTTVQLADGPLLQQQVRVTADPTMNKEPLLNITVDLWQDANGNSKMDTTEIGESLRTQWASP